MKHLAAVSSVTAVGLLLSASPPSQEPATAPGNWPQWRGPEGTGMSQGDAPTTWSLTENVKWRVDIPGRGCSTPVIWGDRIFLTTAVPTGKEPEPEEQPQEGRRRRSFHGGGGPQVEHSFDVLCLNRNTGEILWHQTAIVTTPHEGHHGTYGSHASNSPVTDGEHLFAFFGSRGLYCYDMQGELVWKKDFEVKMRMRVEFGEGHHADGFSIWLAGGGIKGGQVIGETDDLGLTVAKDPVHMNDFQATVLHCLGLDHTQLTYRHMGRDFRLTDVGGRVVEKMLA